MIKTLTEDSEKLFSILVLTQDGEQKKVPLEFPELVIGKGKDAHVKVNEPNAGDIHLKITRQGDQFYIEIQPGFLTLLNNQILESVSPLVSGDTLNIGKTQIQFLESTVAEEQTKEKPKDSEAGKTQFMTVFKVEEENSRGRLVGVSGQIKGRVFNINKDKISIGRDPSNDICIEQDGLSRAHAVLEIGDKNITVLDFNSTNGTFVNGKKIVSEVVKPGTVIQFANAALRYEMSNPNGEETGTTFFGKFVKWTVTLVLLAFITGGGVYLFNYYSTEKQKRILEQKKKELENLAESVKKESPDKKLQIAEQACTEGQYSEAMKIVDGVLEENPANAGGLLLKGKIIKAKKYADVNTSFQKGLRYYEANEFDKAKEVLQTIEADFEKYEEVKTLLEKLEQFPAMEAACSQANEDFKAGNLDKVRDSAASILKIIPVYKKALNLKNQIQEMEQCLASVRDAEKQGDSQAVIKFLSQIMEKVPDPGNYYNQLAAKKMKELTTGKNLRAELFYVSGVESIAQRKYAAAYDFFKKASSLDSESVKIRIALSESRQRRQKILTSCYQASLIVEKENPAKAKILWKKIVDFGSEENEFYQTALQKLEN
jgi:pSer/pThr/pTyr-binding forkhead associated (FHA) protein